MKDANFPTALPSVGRIGAPSARDAGGGLDGGATVMEDRQPDPRREQHRRVRRANAA